MLVTYLVIPGEGECLSHKHINYLRDPENSTPHSTEVKDIWNDISTLPHAFLLFTEGIIYNAFLYITPPCKTL